MGEDGIRRQDQRLTLPPPTAPWVMLRYDNAIIRESAAFWSALEDGGETGFDGQYRRTVAQFDTGDRAGLVLRSLGAPVLRRTVYAVRHRSRSLDPLLTTMVDALRDRRPAA